MVKRYLVPTVVLLAVLVGLMVVAVATPVLLAQSSDSDSDPLTLYDKNKDGMIDADEFILAFNDYLEGRISANLLMRVRELYLSTAPSRTPRFWSDICNTYDADGNDVISRDEVVAAVRDYLFENKLTRDEVLRVIECYYATTAHLVRFTRTAYSVDEGSSNGVNITLEMIRPYGASTVDIPIEVKSGGSAESGDFGFMRGVTGASTTTATFAASTTITVFTLYAAQDGDSADETVILGFGEFSTSTVPMDVYPSSQMGTTTVTIVDDDDSPDRQPSFGSATVSDRTYSTGSSVSLTLPTATGGDGTLSYSINGLPPGLRFTSTTRRITGSLTSVGSYDVTYTVTDADGDTDQIEFTITIQAPPTFNEGTATTRTVPENTSSGTNIGSAVSASDSDGDTLTYRLGGRDAASFSIDAANGQLRTSAALDFETKSSYSVTVTVSDGNGGSASIAVTITVTDVDERPEMPDPPTVSLQIAGRGVKVELQGNLYT